LSSDEKRNNGKEKSDGDDCSDKSSGEDVADATVLSKALLLARAMILAPFLRGWIWEFLGVFWWWRGTIIPLVIERTGE
jgi:hypothetical protein